MCLFIIFDANQIYKIQNRFIGNNIFFPLKACLVSFLNLNLREDFSESLIYT